MSAAAMSGCPASMQATIMRYLLTKPLNGGRPMMDTMPMLIQPTAHGISWTRPARSESLRLPTRKMRPPAQRKSKSFMIAGFWTWDSAPAAASHVPRPRTVKISPTCPMVE